MRSPHKHSQLLGPAHVRIALQKLLLVGLAKPVAAARLEIIYPIDQ